MAVNVGDCHSLAMTVNVGDCHWLPLLTLLSSLSFSTEMTCVAGGADRVVDREPEEDPDLLAVPAHKASPKQSSPKATLNRRTLCRKITENTDV